MSRIDQMVGQYRVLAEYIFSGIILAAKKARWLTQGTMTIYQPLKPAKKIVKDLAAKGQAKEVTNYKIRDWLISRQRYWARQYRLFTATNGGAQPVPKTSCQLNYQRSKLPAHR